MELQPINCNFKRCIDYVRWYRRSSNTGGVGKNKLFSSKMHLYLENGKKIRLKLGLLLMTDMKLRMRFRLAQKSMTLHDLELACSFEFSEKFVGFRTFGRQQLLNECQGQRCTTECTFQHCVPCIDLLFRFLRYRAFIHALLSCAYVSVI